MNVVSRTLAVVVPNVLVAAALAGDIAYRINGGAPQVIAITSPTQPVEIDLGTSLITSNTDIHIYDVVTADVVDSVGMISIRGSVQAGIPVRIVIASEGLSSVGDAFQDPRDQLAPGLRNLGGLTFVGPVGDEANTSLRDNAAVSVTVRGDITGPITAGKIWRVDSLRFDSDANPANHFGGSISGDITSTNDDYAVNIAGIPGWFESSIQFVRAGWELAGNVYSAAPRDANGDPTFTPGNPTTWGSIGRVVVGPSIAAPGITGSILAEYGEIREILSTGQIGLDAESRSQIRAGVRIGRIVRWHRRELPRATEIGSAISVLTTIDVAPPLPAFLPASCLPPFSR